MQHGFYTRIKGSIQGLLILGLLLPVFGFAASVTVSWQPNTESDLAGYVVYYGTASRTYTESERINGTGTTQVRIEGLAQEEPYFLAVTAFDRNGNESAFSEEKTFTITDKNPPELLSVQTRDADQIVLVFSEKLDPASANIEQNYQISPDIVVQLAELQEDGCSVALTTTGHNEGQYTVTINNLRDMAGVPNIIATDTEGTYSFSSGDKVAPAVDSVEVVRDDFLLVWFSEPLKQSPVYQASNFSISPSIAVKGTGLDGTQSIVNLQTSGHTPGARYTLTIRNMEDAAGNVLNTTVDYEYIANDASAPQVQAVHVKSSTELDIIFNEKLDKGTALDPSNYQFSAGVAITGMTFSDDGMGVTVTTTAHAAGTHQVTLNGVADEYGNATSGAVASYEFTPPDTQRPIVSSATVTYARQLRVIFSEPVSEISATSLANYAISGGVSIASATLAIDGKTVLLETSAHSKGNYTLTVSGIQDRADNPNSILPNSQMAYSYDPPDVEAPVLISATLIGPDLLDLEFSEAVDKTSAERASNYRISPELAIASASRVSDGGNHVYLKTGVHQSGTSYTVHAEGISDEATVPNTLTSASASYTYQANDQEAPRLESATLQGEGFLELLFSEALSETEAGNTANYRISPSVTVTGASLDRSLRKVFLYTSAHQVGTGYEVTVINLRDRAVPANMIDVSSNSADYTLAGRDQVPPHVADVDVRGNSLIEVLFSEPVDPVTAETESNYSITGETSIEILSARMSYSPNVVWLETSQHVTGDYALTVSGISDLAGQKNTMAGPTTRTYRYSPPDQTPPVLFRVTPVADNMLELEFTEPLDASTAEDTANYAISGDIRVLSAFLDDSRLIVRLVTSDHVTGDYEVTVSDLRDAYGNTDSASQPKPYIFMIADTDKPEIEAIEITAKSQVVVTFDELMDITTAEDEENYKINKNITVENATLNSTQKEVVLTTSPHVAGTYALTVSGIKDASGTNTITAYTRIGYTYFTADTSAPALVDARLLADNLLSLTFSEAISADDASVVANYTIDPPVPVNVASLQSSGNVVWLQTGDHEGGLHTITVTGIHDQSYDANVIGSGNQMQYVWSSPDTAAPKLLHVELLTPMVLELVFDEAISSATAKALANYKISPQIAVNGAYLLDERNVVHLETSRHSASVPYSVEVQGISDRAPVANTMSGPQSMNYTWADADTTAPYIVDYKLTDQRHLEIIFSETVEELSAENRRNYTIRSGVEVTGAVLDTVSMKKVLLETTDHQPFITYEINVKNVKDLAATPNVVAPDRWFKYEMSLSAPLAADNNPPQIARIEVISPTRMDIVFSEMVDRQTAERKENYLLSDSVEVIGAVLDTNQVRVHLTTTAHDYGTSYEIQVRNITDRAAKPNRITSAGSVAYMLGESISVSQVSLKDYTLSLFDIEETLYSDRNYTFAEAPEALLGSIQIKTQNAHKADTSDQFVTFEVSGDAQVIVGLDKRVATPPAWLNDYKATGEQVVSSRSEVYNLYCRKVHSDRVSLGGNGGAEEDAMYLVFVKPLGASSSVIAGLSKSAYELAHIEEGDAYYIDRTYKIAQIPDTLKSLVWIRTANDDKTARDEEFLNFRLKAKSVVYTAFDAKISRLPAWTSGWNQTGERLVDSRGSQFIVLSKEYEKGQVVLGGNGGSDDDNMYLVLIRPLEKESEETEAVNLPGYFTLEQNYPNPFNPETTISFRVHKAGDVKLTIYNVLGQVVRVLVDKKVTAGHKEAVVWDGRNSAGSMVATGIYIYRIQQGHFAKTKRMIMVK